MEQIENTNTETLTDVADVQCRVIESESQESKGTQTVDTHEEGRAHMRTAVQNISKSDVQMQRQHPLRILLAEDSLVNMKIALWFLRKLGYHADVVFNGIEALDALKRRVYDVILMDAEMPEMDGRQATMLIRRDFPSDQQPRIIAMTANAKPGDREEYLSIGMNDYITKPLKLEDVIRALSASKPLGDISEYDTLNTDSQSIRKVA